MMENMLLLCFINLLIALGICQLYSLINEGIENCEVKKKKVKFNDCYNLVTYPHQIQNWQETLVIYVTLHKY